MRESVKNKMRTKRGNTEEKVQGDGQVKTKTKSRCDKISYMTQTKARKRRRGA